MTLKPKISIPIKWMWLERTVWAVILIGQLIYFIRDKAVSSQVYKDEIKRLTELYQEDHSQQEDIIKQLKENNEKWDKQNEFNGKGTIIFDLFLNQPTSTKHRP